jgi:hypothetical protein
LLLAKPPQRKGVVACHAGREKGNVTAVDAIVRKNRFVKIVAVTVTKNHVRTSVVVGVNNK